MYKSIVFDLGGVMIDFDPRGYLVDRLCNAETEEEVYDLTFGSEEWKLLDAGLISRFDGNHRMLEKARAAGRAFEVQGVLDDWLHILRPRHRMEELVRRLKSHGYCVYYLSNIPQECWTCSGTGACWTALTVVWLPVRCTSTSRTRRSTGPCWTSILSRLRSACSSTTGWRMCRPPLRWALPASR